MLSSEYDHIRLSDRILSALELSIEQEDLDLAEMLNQALEMALTRGSGGPDFTERREYPTRVEEALNGLREMKGKAGVHAV